MKTEVVIVNNCFYKAQGFHKTKVKKQGSLYFLFDVDTNHLIKIVHVNSIKFSSQEKLLEYKMCLDICPNDL